MHHSKLAILGFGFFASSTRSENTGSRSLTFVNHCDESVHLLLTPGSAPYVSTSSSCASNSDCVEGSSCNTVNNLCFWNVPSPLSGEFRIEGKGGKNEVIFPMLDNEIIWSGNIRACKNGTCFGELSVCNEVGCAVNDTSPVTLVEFTFGRTSPDYYDVSVIHGHNIATEFAPLSPAPPPSSSAPYHCGSPGAVHSSSGLGSCSWDFTPPSPQFRWVAQGGRVCSSDDDCAGRDICGMSDAGGASVCGPLLGYWSHNQFCAHGLGSLPPAPECDLSLPSPNSGQTMWNLLGCIDVPSCYQTTSGDNCCGCVNWQESNSEVSPLTQPCTYENPNWLKYVKPYLAFLKDACPSAYTYPYDDMSSTFICSVMDPATSFNSVNYTVTYCPDKA